MEVGVGAGLELEKFFFEKCKVDFKRSSWRGAGGEGLGKESVVIWRDSSYFETRWGSADTSWRETLKSRIASYLGG